MHPITLRIPNDLLSEIESEADDLGYSNRAEYIRQLLQNREHARDILSTEESSPVVDSETVESNTEQIEAITDDLNTLADRIEKIEQELESGEISDEKESTQSLSSTNDSDVDEATTPASTPMDDLETWLNEQGPQSDNAVTVLREAAKILRDDGPLKTGELKKRLYEAHPDAYSSKNTLWASTVERVYEDAPGFSKPSYGTYTFR